MKNLMVQQKRGQVFNVPMLIIGGLFALVIGVVVLLLFLNVVRTSSIIPAGAEATALTNLAGNTTQGINNFNTYLPTLFIVGAIVMLIGAFAFLYIYMRQRG